MSSLIDWINPSWGQFLLVNILVFVVAFFFSCIALFAVAAIKESTTAVILMGITVIAAFFVGIAGFAFNVYSAYLMISDDMLVNFGQWILLAFYAIAAFGSGSSQRASKMARKE